MKLSMSSVDFRIVFVFRGGGLPVEARSSSLGQNHDFLDFSDSWFYVKFQNSMIFPKCTKWKFSKFANYSELQQAHLHLWTRKLCGNQQNSSRASFFAVARLSTRETGNRRARRNWENFPKNQSKSLIFMIFQDFHDFSRKSWFSKIFAIWLSSTAGVLLG